MDVQPAGVANANVHPRTAASSAMGDNDAMDVDTTPAPNLQLLSAFEAIEALAELLRGALLSFSRSEIVANLGADMLPVFMPPHHASLVDLLRFVDDRWLGVFCDSALREHRHSLLRLHRLLAHARREAEASSPNPKPLTDFALAVESILITISRSRAAYAARLRSVLRKLATSSNSNSNSNTNTATPTRAVARGNHLDATFAESSPALSVHNAPAAPVTAPTAAPRSAKAQQSKMMVVLDGSNIAWRHGCSRQFSMRGALLALHYFESRGHEVALFLPEARFENLDSTYGGRTDIDEVDTNGTRPTLARLEKLRSSQNLVLTPADDYDDAYLCAFARSHAAVILSNDAFRDHVYQARADGDQVAAEWQEWFRTCRCTFTFRGDEFLPNPAFNWQRAASVAARLRTSE